MFTGMLTAVGRCSLNLGAQISLDPVLLLDPVRGGLTFVLLSKTSNYCWIEAEILSDCLFASMPLLSAAGSRLSFSARRPTTVGLKRKFYLTAFLPPCRLYATSSLVFLGDFSAPPDLALSSLSVFGAFSRLHDLFCHPVTCDLQHLMKNLYGNSPVGLNFALDVFMLFHNSSHFARLHVFPSLLRNTFMFTDFVLEAADDVVFVLT